MNKAKFIIAIAALLAFQAFKAPQREQKITIVAAANLKAAMDSIISVFKIQNPGAEVTVTYGASGTLFQQIVNDAPFDLFFSADMGYAQKLKEKGFAISKVKVYAVGQLAIWSKKTDPDLRQINSLLEPAINKIAIANPRVAPYGEKAVESMKYYGVYDKVKDKFVYGENIIQTAQFVTSGAADIGIVALSLALSPNMLKKHGHYYVIPGNSHQPLEQGCVVLKHGNGNSTATAFFNFVSSPSVLDIYKHFGYTQPK